MSESILMLSLVMAPSGDFNRNTGHFRVVREAEVAADRERRIHPLNDVPSAGYRTVCRRFLRWAISGLRNPDSIVFVRMLADWYVYAPNGGPVWIVATGTISGDTAVLQGFQKIGNGGRFPPNFDPSKLQDLPWGTLIFTFTDCDSGQVSWQPVVAGYTSGSMAITRLTIPAGLSCP